MKPIRLVVQAFGPYADVQIFDFRSLGKHTFFLIHGDTGSGKSTILDAICYALYGDSSGGERTGTQLRSHHAPLARPTSVSFDFAIGGDHYRVTRSPEYERPSKRGSGTVAEPQSGRLWLRNGCVDEREPGEILAERWEKVNREVIALLGFECNQFRQVVVLPQGQFRDFLVAPSDEREAILSVLFKTDEYRTIEVALKEAANGIVREQKLQRQRLTDLLKGAGVSDLAALRLEHTQRAAERDALQEIIELLRTGVDEARGKLQEGQEAQRKLNERELAAQLVNELESRRPQVDTQRRELDQGRRAAALADVEQAVEQRLAEALDAEAERERARKHYDAELTSREQARATLILAEQDEPEIELLRQRLSQLTELGERLGALEEARKKFQIVEGRHLGLTTQLGDRQRSLEEENAALQHSEQILAATREIAGQGEARKLRAEHLARVCEQREHLESASRQLVEVAQAEATLAEDHEQLVAQHEAAQHQLESVEHAWYAGQASLLAQQLATGKPCPVCGSPDHPAPAALAPDVPTEAALKRQRDTVRKQEKLRQDALQQLTDKRSILAEVRATHSALTAALADQRDAALDELREALRRAKLDVKASQDAQEALPGLESLREATLGKVTQLQAELMSLTDSLSVAAADVGAAQAVLTEREQNVPEQLRTRTALDAATTAANQKRAQLVATLERARTRATNAEAEVAAAESAWAARVEASEQSRQRAYEQQMTFVERLAGARFSDRESYNSAKRSAETLAELEANIAAYERDVAIAADRLRTATEVAIGLVPPDMDELVAAAERAREIHEEALQREAALGEQVAQYAGWCIEREKLSAAVEQLQRRYEVLGEIARIANGDNPYRMSFRRFVLAALLDQVLANASHRLQVMSRGRYTLQRALDQQDRRSAGGLELEVLDLFTGRARLAKTLSGGESFLASLALALGLADVVQGRTGGIHLETMFVDEGFGSLDERALDQAVHALAELQQGGRLVGIISHVTELQRRIAARLEVTASPSGSKAQFVISSSL